MLQKYGVTFVYEENMENFKVWPILYYASEIWSDVCISRKKTLKCWWACNVFLSSLFGN